MKMQHFLSLCQKGNLSKAKKYSHSNTFKMRHLWFRKEIFDTFLIVCQNGHLDTMEWMICTFNIFEQLSSEEKGNALSISAEYGHLNVVKWLCKHLAFNKSYKKLAFRKALIGEHLNVVEWLLEDCNITYEDVKHTISFAITSLCENQRCCSLEWLSDHFKSIDVIPDTVCKFGTVVTVNWMLQFFDNAIMQTKKHLLIGICVEYDKLPTLKILATHFNLTAMDMQFSDNLAFRQCCKYKNLEILKWLVDTFQLTPNDAKSKQNYALRYCCKKGYLEIAQYLVERFNLTIEDIRSKNKKILVNLCHYRYCYPVLCLQVPKWIFHEFRITEKDWDPQMLIMCCKTKNVNILNLLLKEFPDLQYPEQYDSYIQELKDKLYNDGDEFDIMVKPAVDE